MPSKRSKQPPQWSVYPALHHDVLHLLGDYNLQYDFQESANWRHCTKEYDTNIMGRFICHNNTCNVRGWSSRKIAITIRAYPEAQYDATVYHQRCQGCNKPWKPILDSTYAERVAYRLKKWSGIAGDTPYYSPKNTRPHRIELCEGCRGGHCTQLRIKGSSLSEGDNPSTKFLSGTS